MGRPRKPNSLKILQGDQPCRINRDEPKSAPGLGEPPDWFDELSKQAWRRLADRLDEMGISARADSEAAVLYCRAYSMWIKCSAAVSKDGLTITTETTVKPHPLLAQVNESARQMARLLGQFGLTPSSRAGLHVREEPAEDPLIAFMARKSKAAPDGKRRSS